MFNLIQTIICCCLLKICSVGAQITTCIDGTKTFNNPNRANFHCTVSNGSDAFWALNDNVLARCTAENCIPNYREYLVDRDNSDRLDSIIQLTILDNFGDKIAGNLTCAEVAGGKRIAVDSCTVIVNQDGGWAFWSPYGSCTVTCGGGSKTRARTCSDPAPFGNGESCTGSGSESTSCNTQVCPEETPEWFSITTQSHLMEFLEGNTDAVLAEKDPIKRRKKAMIARTATLELMDLFLAKLDSDQSDQSELPTEKNLTRFWSSVEDVGPVIASSLDVGEVMTKKQSNVESLFVKEDRNVTYMTYQFSDSSYFELSPMNSFDAVTSTKNDTSISLCVYYITNIENLVYYLSLKSDAVGVTQSVINSQVMVIAVRVGDVYRQNLQLSQNISLTLKLKYTQGLTQPVCVSFNAGNFTPTSSGCYNQQFNSTHVRCLCNHLSGFAVLLSVVEVDHTIDTPVLDMLSSICLSLSCFCLLLAVLTFCGFSKLRWDRYFTLANLSLSLGLAQMLYLFGIYQVSIKVVCAVIAGLLHFWFLAAFCWMGVDGLQLYLKLVVVFQTSRDMKSIYVLIGYGIPTIIVAISAGMRYDGYGTKTRCWLSFEGWFHMAFIGPVVVIIIWNIIILFIAVTVMRRHLYGPSLDKQNLKKQLKGAVALLAVLGITWLFGLMQVNDRWSYVFSYIFVLLNGTQGVFIFLFQCLLSNEVMTEYYRAVYKSHIIPARYKQLLLNLLSKSTDTTGMGGPGTTVMGGPGTTVMGGPGRSKAGCEPSTFTKKGVVRAPLAPEPLEEALPNDLMTADDKHITVLVMDKPPGMHLGEADEGTTVDNATDMKTPEEKGFVSNIPAHASVSITAKSKESMTADDKHITVFVMDKPPGMHLGEADEGTTVDNAKSKESMVHGS